MDRTYLTVRKKVDIMLLVFLQATGKYLQTLKIYYLCKVYVSTAEIKGSIIFKKRSERTESSSKYSKTHLDCFSFV